MSVEDVDDLIPDEVVVGELFDVELSRDAPLFDCNAACAQCHDSRVRKADS
jgi:hypothetical protein